MSNKSKLVLLTVFSFLVVALIGCSTPKTFVRTTEPAWVSIEVRNDLPYTNAWNSVLDTMVKRFDPEILSQQDGYVRTTWLYTWTGKLTEKYRVRVTAKFNPEHSRVELKSEAEYGGPGKWVQGYDSRLLETIKTDVMGKIGRTTQ